MKKISTRIIVCFLLFFLHYTEETAQNTSTTKMSKDNPFLKNLKYRNIGPFRGGRSLAVAGHADQPLTFYFGAVGGGVFKTTDGGMKWISVSDTTFKSSSVGSICVAPSDPNIVYVGMGETEIRGNISFGDGVYKSIDAGKTWKHLGLKKSWGIGRVVVHPRDANIVYVAALGNPFGRTEKPMDAEDRGVYRTTDGGTTWQKVLAPTNNKTGAIDVVIDPTNPSVIYASLWECYRTNSQMSSGGEGSGMYKSTDGGSTWTNISKKAGLPVGILGKIEFAVSYFDGKRVWAMVENKNGGIYRSDDGGESWAQVNTDKNLRQRPWYFSEIAADPANHDGLYVLNVGFWYTGDGGKTSRNISIGHGDCHDIWINPKNPDIFILGDDGGAEVTYTKGRTFTELDIPTSQFYHISLDNDFPYHLYGAQQDNSSIRIQSRNTDGYTINRQNWEVVTGGESGYVVADPTNSDIVYGGNYMGELEKLNLKNGQNQSISANPVIYLGAGANEMKYRFQWTFPIVFSPHDPKVLYCTSQYVHKTTNGGHSWELISPDLTRNDPKTTESSGGPITKDNTGAETYATIFAFAESAVQKGLMYAGSDDGYLHVSQDAGKNWTKQTVNGLPEWALMSIIETSRFDAGTAYLAANRYKLDDTKPYLFKTKDFGKTWTKITEGLPDNAFCRVIREDPNYKGLLYAGTEIGLFVSFNDGANWQSLQGNLPLSPVHDLQIHKTERDLCVATHGRSFWILDNLEPVYQLMQDPSVTTKKAVLLKPEDAWRVNGGGFSSPELQAGENAPNAVLVNYYLKEAPKDEIQLRFISADGDSIITYSSKKDKKGKALEINKDFYQKENIQRPGVASAQAGLNTFLWDMRLPDAVDTDPPALIWSGSVVGPKVPPGKYVVEMLLGSEVIGKQDFMIRKDPRVEATDADLVESAKFQIKVRDKLSETHKTVNDLRATRKQINDYMATVTDSTFRKEIEKISKPMLDSLQQVEDELIQHKAKAFQDLLALPLKLNNKLANLASAASSAETKPTESTLKAQDDIIPSIDKQIAKLKKTLDEYVPKFNKMAETQKAAAINIKKGS